MALEEVLVILHARVFHDLPVGPERERARVLPRLRISERIVDDGLVGDVSIVGPCEALGEAHLVAVLMADRRRVDMCSYYDVKCTHAPCTPSLGAVARARKSILLLGPRQTGKSTLIRRLTPDLEIDLSDEETYLEFLRQPGLLKNTIARAGRLLSILDKVGVQKDSFGDSTGKLEL